MAGPPFGKAKFKLNLFEEITEATLKEDVRGTLLSDDRDVIFANTGCTASVRTRPNGNMKLTVAGPIAYLAEAKRLALQCSEANWRFFMQHGHSRTILFTQAWLARYFLIMCPYIHYFCGKRFFDIENSTICSESVFFNIEN